MSNNAPYYMLGPIPTDVAAGYDHVAAAIGAAHSTRYGADLICYITPSEHLALPNEQDVVEGVRVARVGAYIGDMAKYPERVKARDKAMSKARRDLDWGGQFSHALFPQEARAIRDSRAPNNKEVCTMCGEFCANKGSFSLFGHFPAELDFGGELFHQAVSLGKRTVERWRIQRLFVKSATFLGWLSTNFLNASGASLVSKISSSSW